MTKMKLRKGDVVILNAGTEKGKKGKILEISVKDNAILVEGINVRTIHAKAKKQGQESGIIKREKPIHASKANYYCEKCGKGVKLGIKVEADGKKVRFCKKCNEIK
ncbi:MAG: ribosomal protein [Clostridia bacterium]|jgi:large subunit ribosomal protein L24|nr:ribosomal protein [Clostridia bacterium]